MKGREKGNPKVFFAWEKSSFKQMLAFKRIVALLCAVCMLVSGETGYGLTTLAATANEKAAVSESQSEVEIENTADADNAADAIDKDRIEDDAKQGAEAYAASSNTDSPYERAKTKYAVDFHWGDNKYKLQGGRTISLGDLLVLVGIVDEAEKEAFVSNIEKAVFSNSRVASVVKVEEDSTAAELADSRGITSRFSPELTDEDIETALDETISAPDWAFISKESFKTDETLTIYMKDGQTVTINVTDALVRANTTIKNPTVSIKTAGVTQEYASNLNFTLKRDGTAAIAAKNSNNAGTKYYVPDTITYDDYTYQVTDVSALSAQAISGRYLIFDDDLVLHMLEAVPLEYLAPVVDNLANALTDAQKSELAGFTPGEKNSYPDDGNSNNDSIFELFKKSTYDENTNTVTIILKYFQRMKRDVPLDFIFIYDDSGTMSTVAPNHAELNGVTYTFRASQSVWCRIVLQSILQILMEWANNGDDTAATEGHYASDVKSKGYDIRIVPIGFASKAEPGVFCADYASAKEQISHIYSSTSGTAHVYAIEEMTKLAQQSLATEAVHEDGTKEKRHPIVVYLSDFHSNANSTACKKAMVEFRKLRDSDNEPVPVYTVHMFENTYRYDRNIASSNDKMYLVKDTEPIGKMLEVFDTITKDAIGYFVNRSLSVQDAISTDLAGVADSYTVEQDGQVAKSGNTYGWTFTDDNDDRMPAGRMYTQTITIKLDDDKVISPAMKSNDSAKVEKTIEDDEGNVVGTTELNKINDQPQPKTALKLWLGLLDENGNETNTPLINTGQFELQKKVVVGSGETWEVVWGSTPVNTDTSGYIHIPYSADAPFNKGDVYRLVQNTTNTDVSVTEMPATWELTVQSDCTIKSEPVGSIFPMTIKKGYFHMWNEPKMENNAPLVPVIISKVWQNHTPDADDKVSFTVLGNDGDNDPIELPAYKSNDRTAVADFETSELITELTPTTIGDNGNPLGTSTTWSKTVYVPAYTGQKSLSADNRTFFFNLTEGDYSDVTNAQGVTKAAGGYTIREDGIGDEEVDQDTLSVEVDTGVWNVASSESSVTTNETYTYYEYEGVDSSQEVEGINHQAMRYYLLNIEKRSLTGIADVDVITIQLEFDYKDGNGTTNTAQLKIEMGDGDSTHTLNTVGKYVYGILLPSEWTIVKDTYNNLYINDVLQDTSNYLHLALNAGNYASHAYHSEHWNIKTNGESLKTKSNGSSWSDVHVVTDVKYYSLYLENNNTVADNKPVVQTIDLKIATSIDNEEQLVWIHLKLQAEKSFSNDHVKHIYSINLPSAWPIDDNSIKAIKINGIDKTFTPTGTYADYQFYLLRLQYESSGAYAYHDEETNYGSISYDSTGQTLEMITESHRVERSTNNKMTQTTLTLTNTFTPAYNIKFTSTFTDSSIDAASTGTIAAVTYTVMKDGAVYGSPVTVDRGEVGTMRVFGGSYTVLQTGYTLANGVEVPATDGEFIAYDVDNAAPTVTFSSSDTPGSDKTVTFANTRKKFKVRVVATWDPDDTEYKAVDGTLLDTLAYEVKYTRYDTSQQKLVVEIFETGDEATTITRAGGWAAQHEDIPAYGVNGAETTCDATPDALDDLARNYTTEIRSEKSGSDYIFTIENTINGALIMISKAWNYEGDTDEDSDSLPDYITMPAALKVSVVSSSKTWEVILNEDNSWTANVSVPKGNVTYTVVETAIGYKQGSGTEITYKALGTELAYGDLQWCMDSYRYEARKGSVSTVDDTTLGTDQQSIIRLGAEGAEVAVTNTYPQYIARVSNNASEAEPTWKYFRFMIDSDQLGGIPKGAFDYANSLTGTVNVETILEDHDRYKLSDGFTFNKEGITSLTISTSQDDAWNPLTGEEGSEERFVTTLLKDHTDDSMLAFGSNIQSVKVEDINLDGQQKEFDDHGGAILSSATLTVENVSIQNFMASQGSAIYQSAGTLTIKDSYVSNNKTTVGSGAIDAGANTVKLIFSGNVRIHENTDSDKADSNVYLAFNVDTVINTDGLSEDALVGIRPADGAVFTDRGDRDKIFGTYTGSDANLNHFVNDVKGYFGEKADGGKVKWGFVKVPMIPINVEKAWNCDVPDGVTSVNFTIYGVNGETEYALEAYDAEDVTADDTRKVTQLTAADGWKTLVYVPEYTQDGSGNRIFFTDEDEQYFYTVKEYNMPTVTEGVWAEPTVSVTPGKVTPGDTIPANTEMELPIDTYTSYPYTFYCEFNTEASGTTWWGGQYAGYPTIDTIELKFSHKKTPEISYTLHLKAVRKVATEGTAKYYVEIKSPTGYIANYKVDYLLINGKKDQARNISLITKKQLDQLNVYRFVQTTPQMIKYTSNEDIQEPATVEPATLTMTNSLVVCKITDAAGTLLYVNGKPAVYPSLMGTDASASAFGAMRAGTSFAYSDGAAATPAQVKMLSATHATGTGNWARTYAVVPDMKFTLTTASADDKDGYPYVGGAGTYSTIYRGSYLQEMFVLNGDNVDMTVSNITIDGRSDINSSALTYIEDNTALFTVEHSDAKLTLDSGAVLQNGASRKWSSIYVGVNSSNGDVASKHPVVEMKDGAVIQNCVSSSGDTGGETGGAVYVTKNGSFTMSGGRITGAADSAGNLIASSNNGGAIYADQNGSVTVSGGTIEKCKVKNNGGAICLRDTSSLSMTGGAISGNEAAASGGAIYVSAGASASLRQESTAAAPVNPTIIGNKAGTGAGIYLGTPISETDAEGVTTIKHAVLEIEGEPDFGGTGVKSDDSGEGYVLDTTDSKYNLSTVTLAGSAKNGGMDYSKARQDIYISGSSAEGEPLASIVVTGELTGGSGTIWVWAAAEKHYKMLKQFATVKDGVSISNDSYKVFRNAKEDGDTDCGGDYLTGQKGDDINGVVCIYWTGGFDVYFFKRTAFADDASVSAAVDASVADSDGIRGEALAGAVFQLFSDAACTDALKISGEDVKALSADGTDTFLDSKGVQLDKGEVLFNKVPAGIYYMKEINALGGTGSTDDPEGSSGDAGDTGDGGSSGGSGESGSSGGSGGSSSSAMAALISTAEKSLPTTTKVSGEKTYTYKWQSDDVYVVLVGETAMTVPAITTGTIWASDGLLGDISQDAVNAQAGRNTEDGKFIKDFAIFRVDVKTSRDGDGGTVVTRKASVMPDVNKLGIMNESPVKREVILKKADGSTYSPLETAHLRIFGTDLTELTDQWPINSETSKPFGFYRSLSSGVIYIGNLPYGSYYLVETQAPHLMINADGTSSETTKYNGNTGRVFLLTVSATGTKVEQKKKMTIPGSLEGASDSEKEAYVVSEFTKWVKGAD